MVSDASPASGNGDAAEELSIIDSADPADELASTGPKQTQLVSTGHVACGPGHASGVVWHTTVLETASASFTDQRQRQEVWLWTAARSSALHKGTQTNI